MDTLTIGELAREAQVNVETVRYYERRGLVHDPPRRESGYRQYPHETVGRIRFIKRAKELGFSLREVSELLALRIDLDTTCDDVRQQADRKLNEIKQKIQALRGIEVALSRMIWLCAGKRPTGECPILEALEESEGGDHANR